MLLIGWLLILTACTSQTGDFAGAVQRVHDGDTLLVDGVKVRLYGIDAPELAQPGGEASRDHLRALVRGGRVKVVFMDKDAYGRVVGRVFLPDGSDVCAEMVRTGHAWVYRKYCRDCRDLLAAEALARWRGIGLWSEKAPTPPWQWRRQKRRSAFGSKEVAHFKNSLGQWGRFGPGGAAGRDRPCRG
ncbi:thermonuclease family protein [Fundidesulfovibrio butyratiphilus]